MSQIATIITATRRLPRAVWRLINRHFMGSVRKYRPYSRPSCSWPQYRKKPRYRVSVVKTFEGLNNATIFDRQKFWLHTFVAQRARGSSQKKIESGRTGRFFSWPDAA